MSGKKATEPRRGHRKHPPPPSHLRSSCNVPPLPPSSPRQSHPSSPVDFSEKKTEKNEEVKMEPPTPTRVMIAVNESSFNGYPHPSISSRRAFDWTLDKIVRDNASGFLLLLLHVQVPDEDGFNDMDSIYASPEDFKNMKSTKKKRGLHLLEYFVKQCHEIGVACEAWIRKGDPKEVICHEVQHVQPDFLVVGCRGLGPFQRVIVGTVSEFCVKHAECPVIAIKRRPEETPQDPVDD